MLQNAWSFGFKASPACLSGADLKLEALTLNYPIPLELSTGKLQK